MYRIMKRTTSTMIAILLLSLVLLSGCGSNASTAGSLSQNNEQPAAAATTAIQESNAAEAGLSGKAEGQSSAQPDAPVDGSAASERPETGLSETLIEALIPEPTGDVVVIRDKLFIAQTNDILSNRADYLNKTIQYEGLFDIYVSPVTGAKRCSVVRQSPGCCGADGIVGFEVQWDKEYPNKNDWVEAVGILGEYEADDGYKYLRLELTSLTVLPTRGEVFVNT